MSCLQMSSHCFNANSIDSGFENNSMLNYYYNLEPEYVHEEEDAISQELIGLSDEDVTQHYSHFEPYNNNVDEDMLDFSYHLHSDYYCCSDSSLMVDEPLRTLSSSPQLSVQLHPEQISLQIHRNEELARLLSPIRKCQEQMQSQQTRKNAENVRRKFSLTNGIRPKQRQINPSSSSKPARLSVSVRRWQSEIFNKLSVQQQCKQKSAVAPNVSVPLNQRTEWHSDDAIEEEQQQRLPAYQRSSSLQIVHEWKQEEYCCSSR